MLYAVTLFHAVLGPVIRVTICRLHIMTFTFSFLFFFFLNPTRTRLSVVECAYDTCQYVEHNKLHAPIRVLPLTQHVTTWTHIDAAFVLHIYTTKFSARSVRTFETKQKSQIRHSTLSGTKCLCRRQNSKRFMQIFYLWIYDVLKYFFFFNVILIIAGFATERRSVWMHVWNFLFALSSVSFAIFSLAWVTYDYWLLHFVDGSALRTIAVRHNNIQATKTAASAIVALIRKRCNDVDEDMLKWKTDIFAKAIIFFNISI